MSTIARIAISAAAAAALLSGCTSSDEGSNAPDVDWTRIDSQELDGMIEAGDVHLVNVHVPYEGEIPGTDAFIPYTEIDQIEREIGAAEGQLVLYCRSGNMSAQTARALVDRGVTDFVELEGGYQAWQDAGLPFDVN